MELLNLDAKGQAAITDALFFLMIVSVLCVIMFMYAIPYGGTIGNKITKQYLQDYSTSALKTILYSSISREPGKTLEEADELDYVLTAVKEDYADDKQLSDETKEVLKGDVAQIMAPFAPSFDYLFYIYLPNDDKFAFFMLYKSDFEYESTGRRVEINKGTDSIFFCSPESLNDDINFLGRVGRNHGSGSRIQLVKIENKGSGGSPDTATIPAEVRLTMWAATKANLSEGLKCALNEEVGRT